MKNSETIKKGVDVSSRERKMEDKQETLKTASKVRYELKPNSFLDLFFIFIFPLQITVTRF